MSGRIKISTNVTNFSVRKYICIMIGNKTYFVELFGQLGDRLKNGVPRQIVSMACKENTWFTPRNITTAIDAICQQMLEREKIRRWLAQYDIRYDTPKRVGVVMAGNIPAVGFFDLMCVLCAGHECVVKMSSKDAVLMNFIIEELRAIDSSVHISIMTDTSVLDAVIATGSDNSAIWFKSRFADMPMLLRGSMHSLALIKGTESREELKGLTQDIFLHSGLGCRNVSTLLVPRDYPINVLAEELNSGRDLVSSHYLGNYRQTRALYQMRGESFIDGGFFVLKESDEFPSDRLSCITFKRYDDVSQVEEWMAQNIADIQCVVGDVPFGSAQYPALDDYPDRKDVMTFLMGI